MHARLNELQGDYDRGTSTEKRAAQRRIARALPATQASVGRLCGIEDRAREQVTNLGEHVIEHRLAIQSYGAPQNTAQHGGREIKVGHSSGTRFIFAVVLIAAQDRLHRHPRCALVILSDLEEEGLDVISSNVAKLPEDNRDPARYGRRLETWRRHVETAGGRWRIMPEPADVVALLGDRSGNGKV